MIFHLLWIKFTLKSWGIDIENSPMITRYSGAVAINEKAPSPVRNLSPNWKFASPLSIAKIMSSKWRKNSFVSFHPQKSPSSRTLLMVEVCWRHDILVILWKFTTFLDIGMFATSYSNRIGRNMLQSHKLFCFDFFFFRNCL